MPPKGRERSKSLPKAKAAPGTRSLRDLAGLRRADSREPGQSEKSEKLKQAEALLRECLAEPDVSRTDGRVLDIAIGQARLLEDSGLEAALLKRAEARLEELRAFESELQQKAIDLRARKAEVLEQHASENKKFEASLAARQEAKKSVDSLFEAVSDGQVDAVRKLLNLAGAASIGVDAPPPLPVDVEDHDGNTPLSEAACYGELDLVELLLEAGAHLDTRNSQGRTPVWRATYNGHMEAVKLLLERGADPSIESAEGKPAGEYGTPGTKALLASWTAEKTAQTREKLSALQRLRKPWPGLLLEASRTGDISTAREVLSALKSEAVEFGGQAAMMRTLVDAEQTADALWTACCFGQLDMCKALLEARSDVDSCNDSGLTCLMIACRKGHCEVVEELLRGGSRTFLRSAQGHLAAEYAAEMRGGAGDRVHTLLLTHCRQTEDWSTLEWEGRQSGSAPGGSEAGLRGRSCAAASAAAATAELRAMNAEELKGERYQELLEQRALADVLGIG
ncbi:unnamed protein product [Polarella glacialis]|uniref:Uncharacterized protein n=1 Tax=Polarella glacialis TaxID=89957 RepID=A0A813KEZ1_POLGL|nr:unnamed protein product [Polarella glacialis]